MIGRKRWMKAVDAPRVEAALKEAEEKTSGEIRVSVAPYFLGDLHAEAGRAFRRLGMTRTRERNGVLIFVVPSRRSFVVRGDEGVHAKVGQSFWEDTARVLGEHFRKGDFTAGLVEAIRLIGDRLGEHFPHRPSDVNELPDQVDFGPRRPER